METGCTKLLRYRRGQAMRGRFDVDELKCDEGIAACREQGRRWTDWCLVMLGEDMAGFGAKIDKASE